MQTSGSSNVRAERASTGPLLQSWPHFTGEETKTQRRVRLRGSRADSGRAPSSQSSVSAASGALNGEAARPALLEAAREVGGEH